VVKVGKIVYGFGFIGKQGSGDRRQETRNRIQDSLWEIVAFTVLVTGKLKKHTPDFHSLYS
jgi:hypothetical protein